MLFILFWTSRLVIGSQWDSHKPLGFYPKYLKLRSEDEQSFYRFGTTWGKVKNSNFGVE